MNRERPKGPPGVAQPFDAPADTMVPAIPGLRNGYRYHITGLFHDETGFPSTASGIVQGNTERLMKKIEAASRGDELRRVSLHGRCRGRCAQLRMHRPLRARGREEPPERVA